MANEKDNVIELSHVREEREHLKLVRKLEEKAGHDPTPGSIAELMLEAARYLEVRPPWIGRVSQRRIAWLSARVDELEDELIKGRMPVPPRFP